MRAVIQRVSRAAVETEGDTAGAIGAGLLVLLGVHGEDGEKDLRWMAEKILNLRIFDDEKGQMNRSVLDIRGEVLVVSQFTLFGDCRKGRRPSWHAAAPPEQARDLYEQFLSLCRESGLTVRSGIFQAMMEVSLVNSGPVTLLLDSHKTF